MLKAVLFDLDNTLLLFEESKFFEAYSKKLYLKFSDLLSPEEFSEKIIKSTQMMLNNDGQRSNADNFIADFANGLPVDKKELWQRFENFYDNDFEQFQYLMKPLPDSREILLSLKEKNLKLVIATNPMFPMNVQYIRLKWANLGSIPFNLITSADNSTYCKPRLEYYQEICNKIDVPPEQCLMVGNDEFNDMIASKIGMKTYLTTDSEHLSIELSSRMLAKNMTLEMPNPDYKGKLSGLLNVIDSDFPDRI